MDIRDALNRLEPDNDRHWTQDGLPAVQVIRDLTGNQDITRKILMEDFSDVTRHAVQGIESEAIDSIEEELALVERQHSQYVNERNRYDKLVVEAMQRITQLKESLTKYADPNEQTKRRIAHIQNAQKRRIEEKKARDHAMAGKPQPKPTLDELIAAKNNSPKPLIAL